MIVVVATLRAKEGKEEEVREILTGLVSLTRQERGCLQYDLHVAQDDAGAFLFYERWESAKALQAHLMSQHVANALAVSGKLLREPVDIVRYELLDLPNDR